MNLDPNYRAVIILRHFVHFSYNEISDILSVPEKTVKSRLFTARQQLREALEAKGHGHQ
jgi:RNA polymerase sigma-70 factor (ECF subfamily)